MASEQDLIFMRTSLERKFDLTSKIDLNEVEARRRDAFEQKAELDQHSSALEETRKIALEEYEKVYAEFKRAEKASQEAGLALRLHNAALQSTVRVIAECDKQLNAKETYVENTLKQFLLLPPECQKISVDQRRLIDGRKKSPAKPSETFQREYVVSL